MSESENVYQEIYAQVRQIPPGRICSYGRVALLIGRPRHARLVGYALHALRSSGETAGNGVPWWRVVNANGRISNAYEPDLQAALLRAEGVEVDAWQRVDLARYLWMGA